MNMLEFLREQGIAFRHWDHPPVFTCEEARRLKPEIPGAETKNLFCRDKSGKRHFLISVPPDKNVDLKALAKTLGVGKLSLASPERLKKHLGLEPGAVTLLGVINDSSHQVDVVIDQALWGEGEVQCHPLVNTATVVLPLSGLKRFFEVTGHNPTILQVPERGE